MWTKVSDSLPPANVWIDVVWRDRVEHPDDYYYGCLLHDPETYCKDKEMSGLMLCGGIG